MPATKQQPTPLSATEYKPRALFGELSVNQTHASANSKSKKSTNPNEKPVARRVNFTMEDTCFSTLEEHELPRATKQPQEEADGTTATAAPAAPSMALQHSVPSSHAQQEKQEAHAPPRRFFVKPLQTQAVGTEAVAEHPPRSTAVTLLPFPTEPSAPSRAQSVSMPSLTPRSAAGSVAPSTSVSRRTGPFVVSNPESTVAFTSSMEYNAGKRSTVDYLREQQDRSGPLFTYYSAMHRRQRVPVGLVATYQPMEVTSLQRAATTAIPTTENVS